MMNKVQAKTLVFTKQPFIEEEEGYCRRAQWQFNASSQSEISKMAATQMFLGRYYDSNQKPLKGGLLDAHLGPAHRQCGDCETCVKISDCPGHFGYLSNWDILQDEVAQYINSDGCGVPYQMQANTKPLNGLVQRLKGKTGCFRGNLCGKCVESTGRTVISPDSNLKITEVGIQMAQILSHPERLSHHNIDKLRQCVVNGPDKYPGSRMLKHPDVSEWSLRANRKLHADDVKYGDIVDRHLEHGYTVPLNRQPSLHLMSIMCHRARIMPRRTLRSNESVCNSYNADFDGDKMNMHVPQTEEPQTEAAMLMGGIRITGPEALYSGHVLQDLFDLSGTTNIAFTNGESIYVAVDSRITRDADNEIVDNEHYKFLDFNDIVPNIVGTQCGVSGVCKLIPKKIREMVEETGRISIQDVAGWVFNFLKTEAEKKDATEERKEKFRRTTTILSTVDSEGPVMFIINCKNDGPIRIESDQFACCGSGSEYARSVLECRTDYLGMGNADAIIWAQIALAYATRNDRHSGGTIRVRRITKDGVVEEISTDALQIFLKHYEKFNEVEHQIHCKANEPVCETYRDSTLLVLRHPYKILSHEDMMRYIRVLGGQTRYCHSWGLLGGHLELTSIVLDGDHQEAYARADVILEIAHDVRCESQPSQRPKEPTYRMSWLIHDDSFEFILVGRGSDSALRERLLHAYS